MKRAIGFRFSLPAGCQGLARKTEEDSVSPSFRKEQSWKMKPTLSEVNVEGAETKPFPLDIISQPWKRAEPAPNMKSTFPFMVQSSRRVEPESR